MDNVIEFEQPKNERLNWSTIIALAVFHSLAVVGLFYFSWTNLLAAAFIWWFAGSLGIGVGYHRLLTHRGFKTPLWFENFLAVCGSIALQAGPLSWVTTHRLHHAYTDTERDPHSPRRGVFWSHVGWILKGTAQNHPVEVHERYSPDLMKNPFMRFLDKWYWMTNVVIAVPVYFFGGFDMVLWTIFVRTVWGWHATWLVNSATHLWGRVRFESGDDSRNNALVAMVTWGEGWHNNHHAYPRSARHGLAWYEFDWNWVQLKIFEKFGLITDLYAFSIEDDVKPIKKAA
ncbi:MAG: fatty acid desaturase [Pyrinomonadaceae bacterium]